MAENHSSLASALEGDRDERLSHDPASVARRYGAFQLEIYGRGMLGNIVPTVTTDPNKLEMQARKMMTEKGFNYVAGGAGERATMEANRLAFRSWKLIPRMLCDTSSPDLSITLFSQTYPTPLILAPVGVLSVFHEDRETGVASVAAELGLPYTLSTAASSTIEEVAAASGEGALRWYQLYWPQSDDITKSLLDRAWKNGFRVLLVTLDTFSLAWRPWDLDSGYLPFIKGTGNQIGFSDPVFRENFKKATGKEVEDDVIGASVAWQKDVFGKGHVWADIKILKENWRGPVVLKGIQHKDDAILAYETGVDGIVVSNHGGRQLDGAIGSLDVLSEIVDAVGDKITVLFDSGVRTGVDVIKALCLGAKGVLVGRPWVYGLGIGGKEGAKSVLQGLLADIDQSLLLSGIKTVSNCNRGWLRRVRYTEDRVSSS